MERTRIVKRTIVTVVSGIEALLSITGFTIQLLTKLYYHKKINKLKFRLILRIKGPNMDPELRKHLIKQYEEKLDYASLTGIMRQIAEVGIWRK